MSNRKYRWVASIVHQEIPQRERASRRRREKARRAANRKRR